MGARPDIPAMELDLGLESVLPEACDEVDDDPVAADVEVVEAARDTGGGVCPDAEDAAEFRLRGDAGMIGGKSRTILLIVCCLVSFPIL